MFYLRHRVITKPEYIEVFQKVTNEKSVVRVIQHRIK